MPISGNPGPLEADGEKYRVDRGGCSGEYMPAACRLRYKFVKRFVDHEPIELRKLGRGSNFRCGVEHGDRGDYRQAPRVHGH